MTKDEIDSGRKYAAQRFGIPIKEVVWFNCGSSYNRVITTTLSAAKKVAASSKNGSCNGGWFNGMSLGGISRNGENYDTMC
jgi:hypothetical protein